MKYCINCGNELDNSKFCTKCGAKVPDDVQTADNAVNQKRFCTNCGTEMGNEQFCVNCGAKATDNIVVPNYSVGNKIASNNNQKGIFAAVIAVVLVIIIAVGGVFTFGGRSYKSTVKQYITASIKGDAKKIVSLLPKKLVDYAVKDNYDGDKKKFIEYVEKELKTYTDMMDEYGIKPSSVSYEITKEEDMDDDDIEDYEELFEEAGVKNAKIKKGKTVTVKLKVPVDGKTQSTSIKLGVIKVGSSWYMIDFDYDY